MIIVFMNSQMNRSCVKKNSQLFFENKNNVTINYLFLIFFIINLP